MATTFKLIKSSPFEFEGTKHNNYIVAYQGRVFQISTLNWEASDLDVTANSLKVLKPLEVVKKESIDPVTECKVIRLSILPKCDLELGAF
jgi:hypothetical protein